jgi:hypothetical protein
MTAPPPADPVDALLRGITVGRPLPTDFNGNPFPTAARVPVGPVPEWDADR